MGVSEGIKKATKKAELKLVGVASKEQIEAWKNVHGEVYEIKVEDAVGYAKTVSRKCLSYIQSEKNLDSIKTSEYILADVWLGGDERILKVDSYFLGATQQLNKLIKAKTSSLEKL